ncbi:tripeptidyl peptidase A [Mycena maculata]|uniref:Tripeptidyl peptidase A n=1 Tax=Mycena maculata TaxID=230809 RepID=A0AAD7IVG9_9AGAR|nr:tripeptidyl peptidase A [Mycena maculata]
MFPSSLWYLLASTGFIVSASAFSPLVKHSLTDVPSGWAELRDAPFDPGHASYGKHLSKDHVKALSRPSNDSLAVVQAWLAANKASSVKWSSSQDNVSAVVSSGKQVVPLSYSLPEDLFPHVDFVHPAFFGPLRHGAGKFFSHPDVASSLEKRATPVGLNQSDFTSCVNVIDPPRVRNIYNIGNYTPDASLNNHIGVAGYLDIWAGADSLTLYLNDYLPESIGSNYTFGVLSITGPFTADDVSDEGNLDTQLAIQVAYPMTYYITNSVPPYIPDQNQDGEQPGVNEPYLDFIDYVLALDDPPTVITTSYGDDEQTVPRDYANAVCQGFAKLGARGVSVLFSSGDEGLGVNDLPTCNNATTFLPDLPASCPYVTVVGECIGAALTGYTPQVAQSGSSAGFSYYFDRPWYQGGGAFFHYFFNRWDIGGGTSAAVPTAAGIVALLNDWRLRNRKPTMGFLNPFLYGVGAQGLVDITEGLVNGCEQPGFNATKG